MRYFVASILLLAGLQVQAQHRSTTKKSSGLRTEILRMDSLLFNVGFNHCDSAVYQSVLSDSMEFYDDRSGLNNSKQADVQSLIEKCARKNAMTRVLKSTSISKLGDYGALQIGVHDFVINGVVVGSANFIHVWERTSAGWKLKRIISYAHVSTGK